MKIMQIILALLLLAGGSKNGGKCKPASSPGPASVSVWEGESATEPFDINRTDKTATIMAASDMAWLSEQSNAGGENTFEGWSFTLGQDLDMAGKKRTPISQWSPENQVIFKGSFDGRGHSISGLYVDNPGEVNCGCSG